MFRVFSFEGIVFVVLTAAIVFGIGMVVRAALPSEAHAAEANTLGPSTVTPRVVAVDTAASGWDVQLDNQTRLHVEPRVADTGGAAPTVGKVQNFTDQTCLLSACTGYAVFTDARGVVFHGYRP